LNMDASWRDRLQGLLRGGRSWPEGALRYSGACLASPSTEVRPTDRVRLLHYIHNGRYCSRLAANSGFRQSPASRQAKRSRKPADDKPVADAHAADRDTGHPARERGLRQLLRLIRAALPQRIAIMSRKPPSGAFAFLMGVVSLSLRTS
jgi:hypothetical protein